MKIIVFSSLFLFPFLFAFSQKDWTLRKEKSGIQVYTKDVSGSSLRAFKGITTIDSDLSALVAILTDTKGYKKWSTTTESIQLLKKPAPNQWIFYVVSDAPWPVSDRDGIYQISIHQELPSKRVMAKVTCLPNYIPEKPGLVRVPHSVGYWTFAPETNDQIKVEYMNHSEPGGSIPGWLANSSVISLPFNTLTGIKKNIQDAQYQNRVYDFIQN